MTDDLFGELVAMAARAPSADNMQAWSFGRRGECIEVYLEPSRMLPTDVHGMFGWIGIGAAVENLVIAAARRGFSTSVECAVDPTGERPSVVLQLSLGGSDDPLADVLLERATHRGPYEASPLDAVTLTALTEAAGGVDAGVSWATGAENLKRLARLDASSTWIRLEHQPLKEELFDVLRFTDAEVESTRYGLDFGSLGVPLVFRLLARQLRHGWAHWAACRLGLARLVAFLLASSLRAAGALCLISSSGRHPEGYIAAGRAMERIWLAATALGLGVQPHGVLPQYLTKVEDEPEGFLPAHVRVLNGLREPFDAVFPQGRGGHPAMVLRVGRPRGASDARSVRLRPEQLIRDCRML